MSAQMEQALRRLAGKYQQLEAQFKAIAQGVRTPDDVLDAIPGRRIFYPLTGTNVFDATALGTRADPISMSISQDGPWVMTHWPLVLWKPNLPANATNLGRFSPVSSWPLPLQQNEDMDSIDITWEFFDGGSQRSFVNEPAAPMFSRPDNLIELPQKTLFAPNSNLQFIANYSAINFDAAPVVSTTGGELIVSIPGYRILNS
jgi:hypothetical protein